MKKKLLFAKHILHETDFQNAKTRGANIILYNEITFTPDESEILFVNCTSNRGQSTWVTWEENKKAFDLFKKRFPDLFLIQGYNIELACLKALYWSNLKTGYLNYTIKTEYPDIPILYADEMFPENRFKIFIKTVFHWIKYLSKRNRISRSTDTGYKYAIHIKDNFVLGLYKHILKKIVGENDFKVFVDSNVDISLLSGENIKNIEVIGNAEYLLHLPFCNIFKMRNSDWFIWNSILTQWDEINYAFAVAHKICHTELKAVLLNEAENGPYGAVMSEVLTKNKVKVYNTMNGMKAGHAQDAHINFSKWFVWDNQMKEIMIRIGIPEDKLIVSGHLIQDTIKDYTFNNKLGFQVSLLEGKKVVSLFSVKGKLKVKFDALNILKELLQSDLNLILLIRPHPAESDEDYLKMEEMERVFIIRYNQKDQHESLHDQLLVSDLSIVFGSTVGIESKWMNVPCITYEEREDSLLYCVDGKMVIHSRNAGEFKIDLESMLNVKKGTQNSDLPNVSEIIISHITSN